MEPSRTTSALQREIEASRARINQQRRSRKPVASVRSVSTANGTYDVRVDGAQTGVPAPFTRAQRLASFVEQLRTSNQAAVTETAADQPQTASGLTNHIAKASDPVVEIDYPSIQDQTANANANQEIAEAIAALDASRQKYSSLVAEKRLVPERQAFTYSEQMASTKDELVASISAAIATVLTDAKFEPSEEAAIPKLPEVAIADPAIPFSGVDKAPIVSQINQSLEAAALAAPGPAGRQLQQQPKQLANEQPKRDSMEYVDPDVFNVGALIPVGVAAWDVEKFLWPMIIDQFLDIGEQAISRLANFSLDILDGSDHRLAVTSVRSGTGASTIACSVARWAAQMRKRVLLVDANLNNPALATSIGLAPSISWLNVVRESMNVSEAIVRCKSTGVCVMPLGAMTPGQTRPAMLLDHLGRLLQDVHHAFDLIVIDTGEAHQLPLELSSGSRLADAAMIVDSNVASQPFRSTKDALLKFGISKFVAAQNSI
jgi:Mrp family chromosome partitioning ATPase